jgi:phenylalanyl-tRNA synthetase beta chain
MNKKKRVALLRRTCRIDAAKAAKLLNRMSLPAEVVDVDTVRVTIPVTRADILHFCDIAEDCAVAYGFNNIKKTVPKTSCIGNQVDDIQVSSRC